MPQRWRRIVVDRQAAAGREDSRPVPFQLRRGPPGSFSPGHAAHNRHSRYAVRSHRLPSWTDPFLPPVRFLTVGLHVPSEPDMIVPAETVRGTSNSQAPSARPKVTKSPKYLQETVQMSALIDSQVASQDFLPGVARMPWETNERGDKGAQLVSKWCDGQQMDEIRHQVGSRLRQDSPHRHEGSGCRVEFEMNWDLRHFLASNYDSGMIPSIG